MFVFTASISTILSSAHLISRRLSGTGFPPAGIIVQGKAIGPTQVCVDEDLPLRAIQVRPFNLGNVAPVCPEEVPGTQQCHQQGMGKWRPEVERIQGHPDTINIQASFKSLFTRPFFPGSLFCWPKTYPFLGKTAMARGSSRLLLISTVRQEPSSLEASMVFRPVSVQYRFLATQSTASPSVVFSPRPITVSMLLPFRSARLGEQPRQGWMTDQISNRLIPLSSMFP